MTPKALNGIKYKGDNFSKIVVEAKKFQKKKMAALNYDLNQSVDYVA